MAWTLVASNTYTLISGTGTEVKSLPGVPAIGDLVLISNVHSGGAGAGGGVLVGQGYDTLFDSADNGPNTKAYYQVLTVADTTVEIGQASGIVTTGIIELWRADNGIRVPPIDSALLSNSRNTLMPKAPSLTTVTDGALRFIMGGFDTEDIAANVLVPATFSNLQVNDTGQASITVGATVMTATRQEPTPSALDPDAFGTTGSDSQSNWAIHVSFAELVTPPGDSITLTDVTDNKVFQRNGSNQGLIPVSGSYGGATVDNIQYRLVDDGTTTPVPGHDWTVLDAAPTGGTFSETITVTSGGMYNLEVRTRDIGGTVLATDEGTASWGIGVVYGVIGQSNSEQLFTIGAAITPDPGVVKYNEDGWTTVIGGDGATVMGNLISGAMNMPVGMLDYGVGGAALLQEADNVGGWWLDRDPGENLDRFYTGVLGATDDADVLEGVIWIQGHRDATAGTVTEEEYAGLAYGQEGLEDLFAVIRGTIAGPDGGTLPAVIAAVGRQVNTGLDAPYQGIRRAQIRNAKADEACYLTTYYGPPIPDGVHLSGTIAGFQTFGSWLAGACLIQNGTVTSPANNPRMIHVEAADASDTITLYFDQDLEAAVTVYSVEGWYVDEAGTPATISSVTRTAARAIDIVLSAAVTTAADLRIAFQYGAGSTTGNLTMPKTSDIVLPNGAGTINIPAEPFDCTVVEIPTL